jgi:hypothetical protein
LFRCDRFFDRVPCSGFPGQGPAQSERRTREGTHVAATLSASVEGEGGIGKGARPGLRSGVAREVDAILGAEGSFVKRDHENP